LQLLSGHAFCFLLSLHSVCYDDIPIDGLSLAMKPPT
jgi:hypothetical protein